MNFTYRRFRAIARKEFLHIIRDPRSLAISLLLPLIMLLLFGYALSLDVDRIPTFVLDLDRTPASRDLIEAFNGSRYFTIQGTARDYAELTRSINSSKALIGLVIQKDFARDVAQGRDARVQLLLDGSDSNTASIAKGYADALILQKSQQIRETAQNRLGAPKINAPVDGRVRVMYNEDLRSRNYIVPGLVAVILMIIAAMLTSLTVAREWETGTMEQLISTPVRPIELLLGKLVAFFTVGMCDMIICLLVGIFIFGVPLRGNPLELLAVSVIFLFGALCWGIMLSTVARNQLMAYQMGMLTSFLPAFLLSGFIYAVEDMPAVIQAISYIVPARYFVTAIKAIFLKGSSLSVLWVEVSLLTLYAVGVFFLAVRKLHLKVA